jgi:hypothetical protein
MRSDADWLKRAEELSLRGFPAGGTSFGDFFHWAQDDGVENALQLGREMADERAEEIALDMEGKNYRTMSSDEAAHYARSTITPPKPKTREEVLEAALHVIASPNPQSCCILPCYCSMHQAQRALAWKPDKAT